MTTNVLTNDEIEREPGNETDVTDDFYADDLLTKISSETNVFSKNYTKKSITESLIEIFEDKDLYINILNRYNNINFNFRRKYRDYSYIQKTIKLIEIEEKLEKIKNLNNDWADYEDIALPNDNVLNKTRTLIHDLSKLLIFPDRVNPSIDEGICLSFYNDKQVLYFEIYNDGEEGYIIEDLDQKEIIENEDIYEFNTIIERIKEFYSLS